jgi:PAS domain S-box-containing protein/putative nucleotidyltransferase with HDIG domain
LSDESKKILLVEDNPGDARLILIYLNKDLNQVYDVVVARTLSASLKLLEDGCFDIVIMDLVLPDSQGMDTFQQIHEARPDLPIIVLTVLDDKQKAAEAIQAGAQDYLVKGKLQPEVISRAISYSIERKRADKKIRREREKAQHYLDIAGVILLVLDNNGKVEMINQHGCDILGYSEDEVIGKDWVTTFVPKGTQEEVLRIHKQVLSEGGGEYKRYENSIITKGREERVISWRNTTIHDGAGEIIGTLSSGEDITERKQAEAAIRESEERLRQIANTLEDTSWITDWETHKTLFASPAYEKVWGRSLQDLYQDSRNWIDAIHPDDKARAWEKFEELKPNEIYDEEYRIIRPDGTIRWIRDRGYPVLGENGKIYRIAGIAQDITSEKQHELEMGTIAKVSLALRRASSREEMIPIIFEQMTNILDTNGAVYINIDPYSNYYIAEAGCGIWADFGQAIIDTGGITSHVVDSREVYVNNQVNLDPDLRDSQPRFMERATAVACMPMIAQEEVIGALWIARNDPITDESLRLLKSIASIAANAMQRASLHEKTMRSLKRVEALHNIDRAINASLDLHFTLNVLINQVLGQLEVDATSVFLFDEDMKTLRYAAGKGFHSTTELERVTSSLESGLAGRAVLESRMIKALNLEVYEVAPGYRSFLSHEEFVSYIGVPLIAKSRVVGVLEVYNRSPLNPETEWMDFLETLAGQAAIAINNASLYHDLQRSNEELRRGYDQTIEGWALTLEMRDDETKGHSQRVTEMTVAIARELGIGEEELVHIRRGAILHDIGKIAIPDEILNNPGPLTDEEWNLMRQHPIMAAEWLSKIGFLEQALIIPYFHHEKWDGSGYPEGLKGEEIPLPGRIFAIVDVWDALLSDRPYRRAWPEEKALAYIQSESGRHFDPEIVKIFFELIEGSLVSRDLSRVV